MDQLSSTLTSGAMMRIISSAETSVLYVAPGFQTPVAATILTSAQRLGSLGRPTDMDNPSPWSGRTTPSSY